MCKWVKSGANRIDPCMREEIKNLREKGVETLACCCGHGKYPKTIIIRTANGIEEHYSKIKISRKKRFYFRDRDDIFYLPEVVDIP